MPAYSIPDPESLHREIQASHERCRQFGVNPNDTCNLLQNRLTLEELAFRSEQNREFLEIAIAQIGELYQFVSGAGFAVNIADSEGYILHINNQGRRILQWEVPPDGLPIRELFGYVEGAFTGALKGGRPGKFELADGGTLFLDEIGDMATDMQAKLLRVLQTGEVCRIGDHKSTRIDIRVVAVTNVHLKQEVDRKNFREDLFYRIFFLYLYKF